VSIDGCAHQSQGAHLRQRAAGGQRRQFSVLVQHHLAPSALRRALNRERSNVGRSAYTDRVKAILLACDQDEEIDTLVADLQKLPSLRDALGNPIRDLDRYRDEWQDSFRFTFIDPGDFSE